MNSRSSDLFPLARWPSVLDKKFFETFSHILLLAIVGVTILSGSSRDGSTSHKIL
jgi:hypothetical protein